MSAFLSWRLQATNACDVTLVWKSGFESVAQYGISFKYEILLPRVALCADKKFSDPLASEMSDSNPVPVCCLSIHDGIIVVNALPVVRTPEDSIQGQKASFDYVLLCVKALPDVYDLAAVIEKVVEPQHTCILINTTHSLGVETLIEKRFPKNVVLSLVSNADILQLGPAEFEHQGQSEFWVGPANWNPDIPVSIQTDMAEALAMTLGTGEVDCRVSKNIQQQQFERMIGYV